MRDVCYPFVAVVGQENVKKALLLNLINPRIGGVLLCGEKGTAKTTIVRALGSLSTKRIVDLPLNATEDMLIGTVDFEAAIKEGKRSFSSGVLERANENILYVDEINLLSDGLVAAIVSASSSGENLVEREGISYRHDCNFILIGTMNPEEGGLRPQLLDKFGLYVEVKGESDLAKRVEVIRRRIAYENDPKTFSFAYADETERLAKKLAKAIKILSEVKIDENIRRIAAKFAQMGLCEGNRCELLLIETASALAALDGRTYITIGDVKESAEFVLPHRRRNAEPPSTADDQKDTNIIAEDDRKDSEYDHEEVQKPNESQQPQQDEISDELSGDTDLTDAEYTPEPPLGDTAAAPEEQIVEGEEVYEIISLPTSMRDRIERKGTGHRKKTKSGVNKGRYAGFSVVKRKGQCDIAFDATLRAAAPFQKERPKNGCAVVINDSDFRYKKREDHIGATIVFVVDASGSMGAAKRMKETKEAVLSMLMDSYQKRDKIGLIAFRGKQAQVLLNITSSVDLAQKELQQLPTGGRTPLADGLYSAWQLLRARRRKDPEMLPMVVLLTDGRANSALWSDEPVEDALKAARLIASDKITSIVVDTENDFLSFHLAQKIASEMGASYFKVNELRSMQLRRIVTDVTGG